MTCALLRSAAVFPLLVLAIGSAAGGEVETEVPLREVEGQPLGAQVLRLLQALEYLGHPLVDANTTEQLVRAARDRDGGRMQKLLDPQVVLVVSLNPESRVKVVRGPAPARLQQAAYTPVLLKVINESTVTHRPRWVSPQAGAVYAGASPLSLQRQQQPHLRDNENPQRDPNRFLELSMFEDPPLTRSLSGLEVEYRLGLIYSSEAGKREATLGIDVGQGNQELGFRGEAPVLFEIRPARPVKLRIRDSDGRPTVAKLVFRDAQRRVHPPQAKRLAPDFFFQPQIYRRDGDSVLLAPGEYSLTYERGPEYRQVRREFQVPEAGDVELEVSLERWVDPSRDGFYSGDHHIHAAGCAHYTVPTEGVTPEDMFLHVKGEGLNVGCVLTWGPCFDFQRQFFDSRAAAVSEPLTVLKYDLEISGFGSQALGHVCLLNLQNQTYPGSEGTATKGWPTWTTPVMRWAKQQGGFTGYAHSASGLWIDPEAASRRLLQKYDRNEDHQLSLDEAVSGLLPAAFERMDRDRSRGVDFEELKASHEQAAEQLPNLAIPEMNGVGAMEIAVTVAEGVCDFISAMDTRRIQEWNTWYHLLNCGFPLKVSGETDFPCMSSTRVGQGRVYVRLGEVDHVEFSEWCAGLAAGRSYVSDGFAHALDFQVNGRRPGEADVRLDHPGKVSIVARVAFAPETPRGVAHGLADPQVPRYLLGDTVELHGPPNDERVGGGTRVVEIVVNGRAIAQQTVPADGSEQTLKFEVPVEQSSWIALRQFPQLHTNPVQVLVGGLPIRASSASARWCEETIHLLWLNRAKNIAEAERADARQTFDRAIALYQRRGAECREREENAPGSNLQKKEENAPGLNLP